MTFRTLYPLSALARLPSGQAVVVQARVRRVRPFFRRLLDVYLEQDGVQVRGALVSAQRGHGQDLRQGEPGGAGRIVAAGEGRRG